VVAAPARTLAYAGETAALENGDGRSYMTHGPEERITMQALARNAVTLGVLAGLLGAAVPAAAQDPDVIFKKSTVWRPLTPDDKLVVQAIDDPAIEGIACHFTTPERGGISGTIGVAEEVSDISLACRQIGPVRFKEKFEQGAVAFSERRSLIFKRMRIVRGCDAKRNTLVYLVYSDRPIEGSPKNSTSTVPIMPWGTEPAPRCGDWVTG
jgi:CreA protein